MKFGNGAGGRCGYIDVDGDLCLAEGLLARPWYLYRSDFLRFVEWTRNPQGPWLGQVAYWAKFQEDGSLRCEHKYDDHVCAILDPDEVAGMLMLVLASVR